MAVDIEGIVGKENMTLGAKARVIDILRNLNAPATTKRYLYGRWARLVGVEPLKADFDRVAPFGE